MANDKNGNPIQLSSNLITTVKPTSLGKKVPDLKVDVRQVAAKYFRMEGGEVKVPRKRQTSEIWKTEYPWFEELGAPETVYIWSDGKEQIPVTWEADEDDGEGGKGIFMDADGNKYDGSNVMEAANPDARAVEGTPEALQRLRNAITQFNNKTGKRLATRFESAQRDKSGRTIVQTEVVYRVK